MELHCFLKKEMDGIIMKLGMPPSGDYSVFGNAELDLYVSYCRALSDYEAEILQMENSTLETVLLSKYYWTGKTAALHLQILGPNGGLEQQNSRVLEEMDQRLERIDWKAVEELSRAFGTQDA